ncbi:MAG: hypothetical protein ABJB34_12310, partial [Acidobacteriota bacterium]
GILITKIGCIIRSETRYLRRSAQTNTNNINTKKKSYLISRCGLLKSMAVAGLGVPAAPMLNICRFKSFAGSPTECRLLRPADSVQEKYENTFLH